jgi:hypothetical protein
MLSEEGMVPSIRVGDRVPSPNCRSRGALVKHGSRGRADNGELHENCCQLDSLAQQSTRVSQNAAERSAQPLAPGRAIACASFTGSGQAAEGVRHAHLSVLKARRALIEYKLDSPEKQRQLASIAADESWWAEVTIEAILLKYGPWHAPHSSPA